MNYPPLSFKMKKGETFELGKWHPELGAYDDWEVEKLREFAKDHIILTVDPCSLSTGGTLLLVEGYKK